MKQFLYFIILIFSTNVLNTSGKCIYHNKSGFGEFCRSDRYCQHTYLCLNGTCGCKECFYSHGGMCIYSRICEAFSSFNNTILRLNISSTSLRNFAKYNGMYYILDLNGKLYVYNQSWIAQPPRWAIGSFYILSIGSSLYFASSKGILKTDSNLVIQAFYNSTNSSIDSRSMFYDQEKQQILVACPNTLLIQRYDLNLNFISDDFRSSDGRPHGVYMFDSITYVSTTTGIIIKYKNSTKIGSFQTICTAHIHQLTIDEAGVIATPCLTPKAVLMYDINGTYLNKSINTEFAVMHFDFDLNGRGVVIQSSKAFSLDVN